MNEVDVMLRDKHKLIDEAKGDLAILFRRILLQRNIQSIEMQRYMRQWLNDPRNRIPNDGARRSYERGNFFKEITKSHMSWKVFVKCLKFYRLKNVSITIKGEWEDGTQGEYVQHLNMNSNSFGLFSDDSTGNGEDSNTWKEEDESDG